MVQALAQFVAGFAIAFFYSWKMTLVMASVAPLLALCAAFIGKVLLLLSERERGGPRGANCPFTTSDDVQCDREGAGSLRAGWLHSGRSALLHSYGHRVQWTEMGVRQVRVRRTYIHVGAAYYVRYLGKLTPAEFFFH